MQFHTANKFLISFNKLNFIFIRGKENIRVFISKISELNKFNLLYICVLNIFYMNKWRRKTHYDNKTTSNGIFFLNWVFVSYRNISNNNSINDLIMALLDNGYRSN